jgi:hypothetical protein
VGFDDHEFAIFDGFQGVYFVRSHANDDTRIDFGSLLFIREKNPPFDWHYDYRIRDVVLADGLPGR